VLISRLFLLALRLTHPLLFRQVGFLHRWGFYKTLADKRNFIYNRTNVLFSAKEKI
jgi:hypothetical protein